MKRLKISLALILALIMTLTLFACGEKSNNSETATTNAPASSAPEVSADEPGETVTSDAPAVTAAPEESTPGKDTITIAVSGDSGTLDHLGMTGGFVTVANMYLENLMQFDSNNETIWILATGTDKIDDIHYTLHLRENVLFSNGNPFTADDVLFTMNLEKDHMSRFLDVQYVDFEKTAKIDDYTIDLWFKEYTLGNFAISEMLIVDAESYDPVQQGISPVGTGPYKVKEYVVNSHIYLERRDDYWGEPAKVKNMNFKCINELSQVTTALELGDVDVASVPAADAQYIESLGDYTIMKTFSGYAVTAYYNCTPGSNLGSKAARDAISYAWDPQRINSVVYYGYAEITPWPLSTHLIDYDPSFANLDDTYADAHNLEKAKAKAEEAGLIGKTIVVITNGSSDLITMAENLQGDLTSIGVNVDIRNYDQATYYSMIMDPSMYDVAIYGIASPSMESIGMFANYPKLFPLGWADEERLAFTALGDTAYSQPDAAVRDEMLKDIYALFREYTPWHCMIDQVNLLALSKELKGAGDTVFLSGSISYLDLHY